MSQEQTEHQLSELQTGDQVDAPKPASKPMSDLAVAKGEGAQLNTLEDVRNWSEFVCKWGLNPPGLQTVGHVVLATLKGYKLGIDATEALTNIAVINYRPCAFGDLPLQLCYQSGLLENIEEWIDGEGDELTAHCRAKRKGMESPVEHRFSLADAKQAGLYPGTDKYGNHSKRSPWNLYTKRMLQVRARGFVLRDGFPDALAGLAIGEEQRDVVESQGFDPSKTKVYQDADTDPLLNDEGSQE